MLKQTLILIFYNSETQMKSDDHMYILNTEIKLPTMCWINYLNVLNKELFSFFYDSIILNQISIKKHFKFSFISFQHSSKGRKGKKCS